MYLVPLTKFLLYCKVCNIIWLYFKQNPTKRSKHNISHLLSSASGLSVAAQCNTYKPPP